MPPHVTDAPAIERLVVGQILARRRAMSPAVLYSVIDAPQDAIDAAIVTLARRRVIHKGKDDRVRASSPVRHLDLIGMVDV